MNLAVLYDRGEDVDRDPREALYWYDAAATKGDGEAEIRAKALRRQLARLAGR
jgi:TPR repeat protein